MTNPPILAEEPRGSYRRVGTFKPSIAKNMDISSEFVQKRAIDYGIEILHCCFCGHWTPRAGSGNTCPNIRCKSKLFTVYKPSGTNEDIKIH